MRLWHAALSTLVFVIVLAPLTAQQTAVLEGVVLDPGGGVVPGVAVSVTLETGTPQRRTALTDSEGRFRFADLPVGVYRVDYSLPGFSTGTVRNVQVAVGQSSRLTLRIELPPLGAPPPPTRGQTSKPPPTTGEPIPPASQGLAIVPVFYATDRARTPAPDVNYSSDRNPGGALHLGRFDVSIPRDHKMGKVERPSIWTLYKEDPNAHLVITRRTQQTYEEFYENVKSVVGKSTVKEAFVFIHGFNVDFEGAIFRTAQISYDLGFDGAPILYSWPSMATLSPIGYSTDSNNADWTAPHLRWFLEDVAAKSGARKVHLIAHSMGNKALVNALDRMPPSNTKKFSQIVLTAPDIDADTFLQLADAVKRNGQMATLYASANDVALAASKKWQTYRRAGDISEGVTIIPGIDTIDVSAVDTNFVGHFYYGDNTSVVSDIMLLLGEGLPPARRPRLRAEGAPPSRYWRFAP